MKNGWQRKQLGELAELKGRIGWRGLTAKEYTKSGPMFLSVHSLNYGDYVDFRDAFHISEERYTESPEIMLQTDDVLICKDGAGIGKVGIVGDLPDRTTINSSLLLIRSGKDIHPKFLYRCLSSPYFQEIVNSRLNGATTPHLYQRDITEFPVVLPPLPEQRRIVSLLDEAFEGIATAKANAEKNLQNARALFESHLHFVFTQRGKGWVATILGAVCEFVGGSQPPKSVFSKTKSADNIRLIQIRDYKSDKHVVYIPRAQARRFCNADDVMIGRYGPPLFQILRGLDGAYNVALMKAVPDESKLSRDFLFYFLKHSTILQYVIYHSERAAGQIGVTKETLQPYPIALPSLDEQENVVETITELESGTQHLASLYERKLAALDALKTSLLHQAFTGEL